MSNNIELNKIPIGKEYPPEIEEQIKKGELQPYEIQTTYVDMDAINYAIQHRDTTAKLNKKEREQRWNELTVLLQEKEKAGLYHE